MKPSVFSSWRWIVIFGLVAVLGGLAALTLGSVTAVSLPPAWEGVARQAALAPQAAFAGQTAPAFQPAWFARAAGSTSDVAWGDVDGDGDLDLAVSNLVGMAGLGSEYMELYLNQRGVLETTPAWLSQDTAPADALAWGDVDGDGDLDLAVSGHGAQPSRLYYNEAGALQPMAAWWGEDYTSGEQSLAWGDFNRDGRLDLLVGNSYDKLYLYHGAPAGLPVHATWQSEQSAAYCDLAPGDYDNDGWLDVATASCNEYDAAAFLFHNVNGVLSANPVWSATEITHTTAVAWGDVDGDGDLDLAVGLRNTTGHDNNHTRAHLYLNQGGTLETSASWTSNLMAGDITDLAWGDMDRDGDLDLGVAMTPNPTTGLGGQNFILENRDGALQSAPVWLSNERDPSAALAWGDMNGDGALDFAVGNLGRQNKAFRNSGAPALSAAALYTIPLEYNSVRALAWGDVDRDGDLDLAVGTENWLLLYRNRNGVLQSTAVWTVTNYATVTTLAWGDVDSDGDLDLAVGHEYDQPFCALYRNQGGVLTSTPAWSASYPGEAADLAWGDYDNDGDLDLAVSPLYDSMLLFRNQNGDLGQETVWTSNTYNASTAIAWGDVDNDGDLDLAVGNAYYGGAVQLYLNAGGVLQTSAAWTAEDENAPADIAWGDVDGDGDLDLAVGNPGQQNRIYFNENGQLSAHAGWSSTDTYTTNALAWVDVDGDGDLDLATANGQTGNGERNAIYRNEDGQLATAATWFSEEADETLALAWGDVNGDGRPDLAVGNRMPDWDTPGAIKLYLGQGAARAPWAGADNAAQIALANAPADHYAVAGIRQGIIPFTYTLFNASGGVFARTRAFYSSDGGGQWLPAAPVGRGAVSTYYTATAELPAYVDFGSPAAALLGVNTVNRILDVDVWLTITHTNDADLTVELEAPDGTRITLFQNVGLYEENFINTWLSDQAATPIENGAAPFTGVYRPQGRLADFNSSPLNGVWRLRVTDANPGDGGYLARWGLRVTTPEPEPTQLSAGKQRVKAATAGLPAAIPDSGAVNATLTLTDTAALTGLEVWVNLTHPHDADLTLTLISPQGASVPLAQRVGDGANFTRTWFADYALQTIGAGAPPFTGRYRPAGQLSALLGQSPAGVWTLRVRDAVSNGQSGALQGWGLRYQLAGTPYRYEWDVLQSGFLGQSDNVVFRLEAYPAPGASSDHNQQAYVAAQTYPLRVRGSQVRVISGALPISNALVVRIPARSQSGVTYADAHGVPFRTDAQGYLAGQGQIHIGDQLVALAPVTATDLYTLYFTNAAPTLAGLDAPAVTALGVQTLTVSAAQPLLLFNLEVALQWDARQDTDFLSQLEYDLKRASELLYDWSNGQIALGEVAIDDNRAHWDTADVRLYASNRLRPSAIQGGIVTEVISDPQHSTLSYGPGFVRIGATWNRFGESGGTLGEDWPRTLAHELSHYLFYLEDNYLGFNAAGLLIPVDTCTGAMADPYRGDYPYDEFHAAAGWLPGCAATLSQQRSGRADWQTLGVFYPWLNTALANAGPNALPLDVTHIRQIAPAAPPAALRDTLFYLTENGARATVSAYARAFLFQDNWVLDLGRPRLDSVLARGARAGDRLCVFDHALARAGCATLAAGEQTIALRTRADWQPDVIIAPLAPHALQITVRNAPVSDTVELLAQVYAADGQVSWPHPLHSDGEKYVGMVYIPAVDAEGYVHIWVDEPAPRREIVADYTMGGSPAPGSGHWSKAPVMSVDGQALLLGQNLVFPPGEFYALQSATALPAAPAWTTVVGQGYWLLASSGAPALTNASISLMYLGSEVPAGEEPWLRLYYLDEVRWRQLPTQLDTEYNTASAPAQGPGLYALMSSLEIPLPSVGWNLFSYPVSAVRPVTEALLSLGSAYTTVYGYRNNGWLVYDKTLDPELNTLTALEFGHGYWISLTHPITLNLKGAGPQNAALTGMPLLPPATYYGPVLAGPGFTPAVGMPVTAWVNGAVCGQGFTQLHRGAVYYLIHVEAACATPNASIHFQIGDRWMLATVQWNDAAVHWLPQAAFNQLYLPLIWRSP